MDNKELDEEDKRFDQFDFSKIEFKKRQEENELEYIISLLEKEGNNMSINELAYCDYVKVKFGRRLVYASSLLYGVIYKMSGDEEAKKLWKEFSEADERYNRQKKESSKLAEIKQEMKDKGAGVYMPDKKNWEERFCFQVKFDDEWESVDWTTDLYVCKEQNCTFTPDIYWVRLRLEDFNKILQNYVNDQTDIRFIFEWGNDSCIENVALQIECVTDNWIYFVPIKKEQEQ